MLFLISLWLTSIAGRFLNDMVPLVALLAGWIIISVVTPKIDYRQMVRNIRGAGGGLHGLRRGIKLLHVVGIVFIVVLLILPSGLVSRH